MSSFYSCPACDADEGQCTHHVIPDGQRLELAPCPFCGGPPVPHSDCPREIPEDGATASAHVWCHSCGAQGPHIDDTVFEAADERRLLEKACLLWNTKHARQLSCYTAAVRDDINAHPRADHTWPWIA